MNQQYCDPQHNKDIVYWCPGCSLYVCDKCVPDHEEHLVQSIQEVIDGAKAKYQNFKTNLAVKLKALKKFAGDVTIDEWKATIAMVLDQQYQIIVDAITQHKNQTLDSIFQSKFFKDAIEKKSQVEASYPAIESLLTKIQQNIDKLSEITKFAEFPSYQEITQDQFLSNLQTQIMEFTKEKTFHLNDEADFIEIGFDINKLNIDDALICSVIESHIVTPGCKDKDKNEKNSNEAHPKLKEANDKLIALKESFIEKEKELQETQNKYNELENKFNSLLLNKEKLEAESQENKDNLKKALNVIQLLKKQIQETEAEEDDFHEDGIILPTSNGVKWNDILKYMSSRYPANCAACARTGLAYGSIVFACIGGYPKHFYYCQDCHYKMKKQLLSINCTKCPICRGGFHPGF